jgi:hypothetical protein
VDHTSSPFEPLHFSSRLCAILAPLLESMGLTAVAELTYGSTSPKNETVHIFRLPVEPHLLRPEFVGGRKRDF